MKFVPPASRLPRWLLAAIAAAAVGVIPLAALLAQGEGRASFTVAETGRGYSLGRLPGIGAKKLEAYGERFLRVIGDH